MPCSTRSRQPSRYEAMVLSCFRAISSSTGNPFLRAAATVIAVKVLLWQETHPDLRKKVTSLFCSSGMILSIAARTEAAGLGFSAVSFQDHHQTAERERATPC